MRVRRGLRPRLRAHVRCRVASGTCTATRLRRVRPRGRVARRPKGRRSVCRVGSPRRCRGIAEPRAYVVRVSIPRAANTIGPRLGTSSANEDRGPDDRAAKHATKTGGIPPAPPATHRPRIRIPGATLRRAAARKCPPFLPAKRGQAGTPWRDPPPGLTGGGQTSAREARAHCPQDRTPPEDRRRLSLHFVPLPAPLRSARPGSPGMASTLARSGLAQGGMAALRGAKLSLRSAPQTCAHKTAARPPHAEASLCRARAVAWSARRAAFRNPPARPGPVRGLLPAGICLCLVRLLAVSRACRENFIALIEDGPTLRIK